MNAYELSKLTQLRPMTAREEKEVKLAFDLYDLKGDGLIAKDDALKAMTVLGFRPNKEDTFILS